MANAETFENVYFLGSDNDESRFSAECNEGHTVEELSANQTKLNIDISAQVVIDQDSGQFILTKKEAELLLGPQCLEEHTSLIEYQNVSENVNRIPHSCENAQQSTQLKETSGIVLDKIHRMRSILKKVLNTADSRENKTESCYNVEMPSYDVDTQIVTGVSDGETSSDNSTVTLLVKKFSCDKCDRHFHSFVSLCDHQRKAHNAISESISKNEGFNLSGQPSSTENSIQVNNTVIKVQNENLTHIVIDYDIANVRNCQPVFSENNLLLKEQDEMAKTLNIEYCHICSRIFNDKKTRLKHLKTEHSIAPTTNNHIKCLDCSMDFKLRSNLRDHLEEFHNLNTKPVMLYFSTKDAFLTWKCNIERESLCTYFSATGSTANGLRYHCSRSGMKSSSEKYKKTEFHRMRGIGRSIKMGIACPSEIFAEITPKGVLVTYHSTHYGHGGEIGITCVSPAEKVAVDELVSNGFSFEKLMKELKGGEIMDYTQTFPLRKRYLKWVKQAFLAPSFHSSFFSDAECISQWVQKCCSMEESPILLCQLGNIECLKEKFILVIMTEFQKQILLSNFKDLICVDVFGISKRTCIVIYVMDELHRAFPVAYCLCNSFNKYTAAQFFSSIKEQTGRIKPNYLISNMKLCIYEAWVDVMGESPLWLWSQWSNRKLISKQLVRYAVKHEERCEVFDTMKTLMDCKSKDVFACMYKNLVNKLQSNIIFEKFRVWFEQRFGSNFDKWASYCQKDISYKTSLYMESMHFAIDVACCKASRQKSMFRLIHVLMKILRNKMMDRILDSFDDDKTNLALNAINLYHESSVDIPEERITFMCEKLWSVENEDGEKEFVTQETEDCPDHCVLKCKECDICVHMYSCSCVNNMVNSNLCRHIHAVAYKFLKKNSSELPSTSVCEPTNNKNEISLADFESLRKYTQGKKTLFNTSSQHITSTKNFNSSHNLEESPQFETHSSNSDLDERESKQAALKKLLELHQIVKNNDLTDYTLNSLTKHLNLCHKIIKLNKGDPSETKASSSIPINAVYVVKPKNFTNEESVNKKCVKRFRFPSLEERSSNLKKFRDSQPKLSKKRVMETLLSDQRLEVKKLTHTPLMVVLPNKNKSSASTFPTEIQLDISMEE